MRYLLLLVPFFFSSCTVSSSLNTLDTTFGTNGKVTLDFNSAEDGATGVVVQSNGAIIAVGRAYSGATSDFALARFTSAGSLDTTFDDDGKVTTDFGGNDEARAVALQTDGKIVAVGVTTSGSTTQFAVARYNTNGSLDTNFSDDGKLFINLGSSDEANAVAIDSDGKIVIAGSSYNGTVKDFAVVRYNTDGSPDNTFSGDGKMTVHFSSGDSIAHGIALQSDGKILVVGSTKAIGLNDFGAVRIGTDGIVDATFGTNAGKLTIDFLTSPASSDDIAYGVQVLSNGSILIGGTMNNGTNDLLALVRLDSTGVLDSNFGNSGKSTLGYFNTTGDQFSVQGRALALSSGNQPILAGFVHPDTGFDVAVSKFQNDGTKDIGYGTDGIISTDIDTQTDEGHAVAVQSDGKVVVAGRAFNGSNFDFVVLRYQ